MELSSLAFLSFIASSISNDMRDWDLGEVKSCV
jgi:hypothetical protein